MNLKSMPALTVFLLAYFSGISLVLAQTDIDSTEVVEDSQTIDLTEESQEAGQAETEENLANTPDIKIFDRQLIAELEASQQRLLAGLKEEDAFSLKLSELYSEYGALLFRAGRFDEAKQTFSQALHIQKVNHGIYSSEQLYFIKQLFEIALKTDDTELMDSYLSRATAIESKNKDLINDNLAEMFLHAGHYNLDKFYQQKRRYAVKLELLKNARTFFEQLLIRNTGSDEKPLPYGELFLVGYLESTVINDMPLILDGNNPRFGVSALSSNAQAVQLQIDYRYIKRAYNRSFKHFNNYLRNARASGNNQEVMKALLAWADTLTLFGHDAEASIHYKLAWSEAEETLSNKQLLSSFSQPRAIPDYEYLLERPEQYNDQKVISVPLILSVTKVGSISKIEELEGSDEQRKYVASARREVRNLSFRPAIIGGDTTAVDQFSYAVKVDVN